jgi:hypothetical protein
MPFDKQDDRNRCRAGETGPAPMRTDRFFAVNNNWYFSTREGASVGPFGSKTEAKSGLAQFIEFVQLASPKMLESFIDSLRVA